MAKLVGALSWPGVVILMAFFGIFQYGSLEQKREIIDLYVLGKGVNQQWALIAGASLFVFVAFAQYWYYKKQRDRYWEELKRVGAQKSRLQEEILGKRLRHVSDEETHGSN